MKKSEAMDLYEGLNEISPQISYSDKDTIIGREELNNIAIQNKYY